MSLHQTFLNDLRAINPQMVDQALAVGLPSYVLADGMHEEDADIAAQRMQRFAKALLQTPSNWKLHGAGIVQINNPGSSATLDDGTVLSCEENNGTSAARGAFPRLRTTMTSGNTGSIISIGLSEIRPAISESQTFGRSEALATVLATHAGATDLQDTSTFDYASNVAQALMTLLSHDEKHRCDVTFLLSGGAQDHKIKVGTATQGYEWSLDETTADNIKGMLPPMLGLGTSNILPREIHLNLGRRVPTAGYILSRVQMKAKWPHQKPTALATLRAMSFLGLSQMPTLTKKPI